MPSAYFLFAVRRSPLPVSSFQPSAHRNPRRSRRPRRRSRDRRRDAADPSLHDLRARGGRQLSRRAISTRATTTRIAAALERCLTELEGGAAAAAFASGSAATMTLFQALGPGAHVIVPDDAYFGTIKLARDVFGPWGLELSTVDMTDLDARASRDAAEHEARLGRNAVESAAPRRRHRRGRRRSRTAAGALCAVDNTWGTPVLQRPLELGADVVDALDHEIPRRPQRRARRRARLRARTASSLSASPRSR